MPQNYTVAMATGNLQIEGMFSLQLSKKKKKKKKTQQLPPFPPPQEFTSPAQIG